jgi:hypothetical protein
VKAALPVQIPITKYINGILRILYNNNIAVVISTKELLKMSLI